MPRSPLALRVITKTESKYVNLEESVALGVYYGKHQHTIVGKTGNPEDQPAQKDLHTHELSTTLTIDAAGVNAEDHNEFKARSGQVEKALTYVDDLQVWLGPDEDHLVNHTKDIRLQLQSARPSDQDWSKLGEGPMKPNHPLIEKGTGAIQLDFLPNVAFAQGEYLMELRVASGGGRILYNLYVE
ncbi:MAG: hypothetical protein A2010_04365 [Nitrospirae bacterium GWD2_57_9]|nr:MAG: hypothetical protein A2010_04365 [Nitrospirae bacterium GWD2_57_9]